MDYLHSVFLAVLCPNTLSRVALPVLWCRYGLILLGNPRVLSRQPLWNSLLTHFKEHVSLCCGLGQLGVLLLACSMHAVA